MLHCTAYNCARSMWIHIVKLWNKFSLFISKLNNFEICKGDKWIAFRSSLAKQTVLFDLLFFSVSNTN